MTTSTATAEQPATLVEGAALMRRSYGQTLRLGLLGEIRVWREDGHWLVSLASCRDYLRRQGATASVA